MCSSGQNSVLLERVDYPMLGIGDPGWHLVTPDDPTSWDAFCYTSPQRIRGGYFLGRGHTDLEVETLCFDDRLIVCVGGFVYASYGDTLLALSSKLLGYRTYQQFRDGFVFNNYSELLLATESGFFRYTPDAAIDDLQVLDLVNHNLTLAGVRAFGEDDSTWTINSLELPPCPQ